MKKFITFEGIDGSGKTTILRLVAKQLRDRGLDVIETAEPTKSWFGEKVRKCIREEQDPFITTFAFIADRLSHGVEIREWLGKGKIVLCDRYMDSTFAYQGVQLQIYMGDPIKWLKDLTYKYIPIPDRTFLFVIEPEEALERIRDRENLISFEEVPFLTKVQENYRKLEREDVGRFLVIDAKKKIEDIVDICVRDIIS